MFFVTDGDKYLERRDDGGPPDWYIGTNISMIIYFRSREKQHTDDAAEHYELVTA